MNDGVICERFDCTLPSNHYGPCSDKRGSMEDEVRDLIRSHIRIKELSDGIVLCACGRWFENRTTHSIVHQTEVHVEWLREKGIEF